MLERESSTINSKASVFSTIEDDIAQITKTPEEADRIRKKIEEAEEQSRRKQVIITRKYSPLKKFIALWRIRFKYGLHWRKPFYPVRILWNELRGKFYHAFGIKKYILRGIEFAITFRCNFRCNHCLCSRIDESGKRKEMTPNDYKRVVKEAMKLGATTFGMEGGEPFVVPNWEEFIEAWQPKWNHIIISTNGFLMNEEKIKKAYKLGVDTINFSLDSGYSEIHNAFRKKAGSYEKVVDNIKLCKKHGIKVIINCCVHKGNLYTDGFRELLEFTEREKILINTLFAKGTGSFHDKEVMFDKEDIENYEKIIKPYNWVTRHLNFNYGKQWGCPGTKEMINMTPYGDIMNCANMHIYMGNVMEESLAVARDRALRETPFGRYHACFLADDPDFMNMYYSALETKENMTVPEFREILAAYEKKNNKVLYHELHCNQYEQSQ